MPYCVWGTMREGEETMSRRQVPRSPVHLDATGVRELDEGELATILHAANSVVHKGGRRQLTLLLKGSRDKSLIARGLDADESYGALSYLTLDEIGRRVDWAIKKGYLDYYYEWRQPLLTFTDRGWEVERPRVAEGYYHMFAHDVETGEQAMAERMEDIEGDMQRDVVSLIAERCDERAIPHLEAWSEGAFKRTRKKIAWAIRTIEERARKA